MTLSRNKSLTERVSGDSSKEPSARFTILSKPVCLNISRTSSLHPTMVRSLPSFICFFRRSISLSPTDEIYPTLEKSNTTFFVSFGMRSMTWDRSPTVDELIFPVIYRYIVPESYFVVISILKPSFCVSAVCC